MDRTWYFPSNAFGKKAGFNDAAIDIFHGDPVGSLVRESIQNSLDAADPNSGPVRIAFTLSDLDSESAHIPLGLKSAFELGLAKAEKKNDPKARSFYSNALETLRGEKGKQVLGIHDFGTKGLGGTTDDTVDENSAWLALVKGSGDTYKENAGAGGSYGHGSSAPLALSGYRSVLYFTRVPSGNGYEERFQGTSRLESLPAESLIGMPGFTQDQGHFGNGETCGPLLGSEIPSWFGKARDEAKPAGATTEFGTSIFILAPRTDYRPSDFWKRVAISVLANYFYTIGVGKLEVVLGGGTYKIGASSLEQHLRVLGEDVKKNESDYETRTRGGLETARTIASPTLTHNLQVEGFGSIELLLRLDDSITRNHVGIARSNGMLVTREPWLLMSEGLRGFRAFDLFVYVKDEEGSELLRQLEPPAHDAFEINRIEDEELSKQIRKQYSAFKAAIWKFIKVEAKHEIVGEIVSKATAKYFLSNWTGELTGDNDPTNYALVYGTFRRVRPKQGIAVWGNPDDFVGIKSRHGETSRGGTKKGLPPGFDDPLGEDEKAGRKSRRQVTKFRVVRDQKDRNLATVHFNPVDKIHRHLVLLQSGADSADEPLRFRTEKSREWSVSLDLASVSPQARKVLRLVFEPGVLDFAMEARLES